MRFSLEFSDTERKFFKKLFVLIDNLLAVSHLSVEEYTAVFGDDIEADEMIALFRVRGQSVVLKYPDMAEEVEILKRAINVALRSSYFEGRFKLLLGLTESQAELLLNRLNKATNNR